MLSPTVFLRDIHLQWNHQVLFSDLNLSLKAGRWTCLLGPSGVGKTTLLHLIAGLIVATRDLQYQGIIECDNHLSVSQQVAYLFQSDLLMPWLTAFDNATIELRLKKHSLQQKKQHITLAQQLFEDIGLKNYEHYYPHQLSGGMRQRVALIRTLLANKPIILMDEPFSSLDAITRFKLQTLSATLLKNRTVLFITHDPFEALRLADDIYVLSGSPATLASPIQLTTPTPRDPDNPDIKTLYSTLMRELAETHA